MKKLKERIVQEVKQQSKQSEPDGDILVPIRDVIRIVEREIDDFDRVIQKMIKAEQIKKGLAGTSVVGIVRRVDELGRIVIPKEIREKIGITEGSPMEYLLSEDGIILRVYKARLDL